MKNINLNHLKSFESFVGNVNENILPRPHKKVKCAECGEEVCDNINYKIGHLYNKHNCKPSVGDYKAKRMLVQYFTPILKEGISDLLSKYRKIKGPIKVDGETIGIGDKVKVWETGDPLSPEGIKKGEFLYDTGEVVEIYELKNLEKYPFYPMNRFYVKFDNIGTPQYVDPHEISK